MKNIKTISNLFLSLVVALSVVQFGCSDNGQSSEKAVFYQDADSDGYGNADVVKEFKTSKAVTVGTSSTVTDDDGTAYVNNDDDCNDLLPSVSPADAEVAANGIDDNCDGSTDEGEGGEGDLNEETDDDGDGYTETAGDCDDSDSLVHPGGSETSNDGIDSDCNGSDNPSTTPPDTTPPDTPVAVDADGDGYTTDTDCDDANAAVNPGVTEVSNNGIDDNCDGLKGVTKTNAGNINPYSAQDVENDEPEATEETTKIDAAHAFWRGGKISWGPLNGLNEFSSYLSDVSDDVTTDSITLKWDSHTVMSFGDDEHEEDFDWQLFSSHVAYDSSTMKRVYKRKDDVVCESVDGCSGNLEEIDLNSEFGNTWGSDRTGRYKFFVVIRGIDVDSTDNVTGLPAQGATVLAGNLKVAVYNTEHVSEDGTIQPQYNINYVSKHNETLPNFSFTADLRYEVIGIDSNYWADNSFNTYSSTTNTVNVDVSKLGMSSVNSKQVFTALDAWAFKRKPDFNYDQFLSSIYAKTTIDSVNKSGNTVSVTVKTDGSMTDGGAISKTPDNITGYVFVCKDSTVCVTSGDYVSGEVTDIEGEEGQDEAPVVTHSYTFDRTTNMWR